MGIYTYQHQYMAHKLAEVPTLTIVILEHLPTVQHYACKYTHTHPHTHYSCIRSERGWVRAHLFVSPSNLFAMLDYAKTDPPLVMKWAYCGNCIFHKWSCLDSYHMFWDRLTCVFPCPGGLEKSQSETDMFICLHSKAESSFQPSLPVFETNELIVST